MLKKNYDENKMIKKITFFGFFFLTFNIFENINNRELDFQALNERFS